MFNKPEVLVIGRFNGKSKNPSGSSPTYHRVPRPDDKTNRHQWIFVIVILLKCPVLLHEFSVLLFYQYLAGSFSFGKPSCPHVIILICFKFIFLSYSCIASLIFFFFFQLFRGAPVACGSSQARGQIRAVAGSLHHSHSNVQIRAASAAYTTARDNAGSHPRSKARDKTHILMDTSHYTAMGTPFFDFCSQFISSQE